MSARRVLLFLAALLSAAVVSGCVSEIDGNPSRAQGIDAGSGQGQDGSDSDGSGNDESDAPDDDSTDDSSTSAGPPSSSESDDGGGGSASEVCALWSPSELEDIFGEEVSTGQGIATVSCEFETETAGLTVSVYDFLNMDEESKLEPEGKAIQVQGLPGWESENEILVARTPDPKAAGLIVVSHYYSDEQGNEIGLKLLEKAVPEYKK